MTIGVAGRHPDAVTPDETDRFYADFGRRVRTARDAAGLTQQQLADRLGLTRSSIANMEAGRQKALLHMTAAIAETTGVAAADLLPSAAPAAVRPAITSDLRKLSDPNREAVEMLLRQTSRTLGRDAARAAG